LSKKRSTHFLVMLIGSFLLGNNSLLAQDTIYWSPERPLAWEDFIAVPEKGATESAQAATGVALEFQYRETDQKGKWEYQYKVYSYFLPYLSWKKPQDINYYLLEHEQTHFHISELLARKLKEELSKMIADENVGVEAERIYNKMQKDHAALQNKYDQDTKNSLEIDQQLEWQQKIQDSLKQYEDWK